MSKFRKSEWSVGEAKQRFSELIRSVAEQPQLIHNRDRLVATVVDAATFREFAAWKERQGRSLGWAFSELRKLCAEEDYVLEVSVRSDRDSPFTDVLHPSR